MIDTSLVERIVEYMNSLIRADRVAVGALICNRVPCNQALADHPTCQVQGQNGGYYVGLIGILNGLAGTREDDSGAVAVIFEDDPGNPTRRRLDRFEVLPAPASA